MTDNEWKLLSQLDVMVKSMQQIEFICDRAKRFYIEEKDIDEILAVAKQALTPKDPPG